MENIEELHTLVKKMGAIDLFGKIYEALHTTEVENFRNARSQGHEERFLRDLIRSHKRTYSPTCVFPAVIHDPTGEGLAFAQESAYAMGDPTA